MSGGSALFRRQADLSKATEERGFADVPVFALVDDDDRDVGNCGGDGDEAIGGKADCDVDGCGVPLAGNRLDTGARKPRALASESHCDALSMAGSACVASLPSFKREATI